MSILVKNRQYYKFCAYGFLKNLRFFDAFLLLFFMESGISFTQIGILYATREIIINVSEIPSGILADTYGRKKSLIVAFILYIISFLVFYFFNTFYFFILAITFFGIADAFRTGTHKGMIMDYLAINNWQDQKANYYGHTRSWSQKGSALSALIAGFLVLYSGSYHTVFLYSVIPYLINFINIYSYPNSLNYSLNESKKTQQVTLVFVFKSFINALKHPKVLQIINSSSLHSSYLKAIKDYIQPVMLQIALIIPFLMQLDPKRKSGIIIGIIYFIIFLLTSYASKKSFKISEAFGFNISKLTLEIGLVTGMICGVFYEFELWFLTLLFFAFIYIVENIRKPLLIGEIADHVPPELLTSVLSAQSFFSTITTSILAISIGFIADHFGFGIAIIIISCILLLFTEILNIQTLKKFSKNSQS
ncbi:MFS transporter [Yeosuana sp.]|uniref:MFS transporter n=1 Tax=Yeosuana sp. TaxID=2529388 RepID=UPI004054B648|tara:strand:- start:6385 stop:7641 length:1257 start_codon:yes stop_codon:yes gene_type:complete